MEGEEERSPRFAERAVACLVLGETAEAERLCRAGVERFPWYATGHLVLGRCRETAGRYRAAAGCYQQVLQILPGLTLAEVALARVSGRPDEGESGVDFLLRQLGQVKRPPPGTEESGPGKGEILPAGKAEDGNAGRPEARLGKIVTATLAEIYARQGEYGEAVEAYRMLIRQRPVDAGRFAERLAELERLLQGAHKPGEP
jgi:tetratricopeptide (TPR) repeat protein